MPSPHTGDNIRELVDQVLDEWEIPLSKVSAILTDNGSNILAAFCPQLSEVDEVNDDGNVEDEEDANTTPQDANMLILDFEEREMEHELAFHSLKCVSHLVHTLQLMQKSDEVTTYKALIKHAHQVVCKVNSSNKVTEKLIAICGKKLVRD